MLRTTRFFYSNLKTFTELKQLNNYLSHHKFPKTIVYFRANWNPNCQLTDQHITKIASNYPDFQVIKVDTDLAPKISKHYGVKAEPEFVFCLFGDQVLRQTGPNYDGLTSKIQKMQALGQSTDLSHVSQKWLPYGTKFEHYYDTKLKNRYKAFHSDL